MDGAIESRFHSATVYILLTRVLRSQTQRQTGRTDATQGRSQPSSWGEHEKSFTPRKGFLVLCPPPPKGATSQILRENKQKTGFARLGGARAPSAPPPLLGYGPATCPDNTATVVTVLPNHKLITMRGA